MAFVQVKAHNNIVIPVLLQRGKPRGIKPKEIKNTQEDQLPDSSFTNGIFEFEGNRTTFYSFQSPRKIKIYIFKGKNVYWEEFELNFVDQKEPLILQK